MAGDDKHPLSMSEARALAERRTAEMQAAMEKDAEASAPVQGEKADHGPLFVPDVSGFSGRHYVDAEPEPYDWLLKESFALGQLGAFVGPPGAGKGTLSIQLCVAAAAGVPWLGSWHIERPMRALFVSAEDDQKTIHRRLRNALRHIPESKRNMALDNVFGIPVFGNVSLCENTSAGIKKCPVNVADLDILLSSVRPDVLILDTLSRFFAIPENANELMTQACGILEELCRKHGVTPILIHHAGKGHGGDLVAKREDLATALSQHAARGASALAGAVRWMFNVAPLQKDYAADIIGEHAADYSSGHYLAVKVSKKNVGAPEGEIYLERGEGGICFPVKPQKKLSAEETECGFIDRLVEEVTRRELAKEEPLRRSDGAAAVLKLGRTKANAITSRAIYDGKLVVVKKSRGNGEFLALPHRGGENL